jgi:rubrerythrin
MPHDAEDREETIEVVKRNWRAEIETAQTYRDLAGREPDEKRKGILLRMAEAEERHAQRWEQKLRDLGVEPPVLAETIGRRLNRWWNRIAGANIAIRRMEAAEERHEAEFRAQADRALAGEHDVQEFLRQSALEEKAHARALNAMTGPQSLNANAGMDAAAVGYPTRSMARMMVSAPYSESCQA